MPTHEPRRGQQRDSLEFKDGPVKSPERRVPIAGPSQSWLFLNVAGRERECVQRSGQPQSLPHPRGLPSLHNCATALSIHGLPSLPPTPVQEINMGNARVCVCVCLSVSSHRELTSPALMQGKDTRVCDSESAAPLHFGGRGRGEGRAVLINSVLLRSCGILFCSCLFGFFF